MKKTLLFLSCLLILLTGCSKNELDQDGTSDSINTQSSEIRWYGGAKLPQGSQTKGVADGSKRWNLDAGIYIKFINTPSDPQIIDRVKQTAAQWEEYAGIKFHFVDQDKQADVRIAFDWNNNDWLTWSYTGNDAKSVTDQSQPTAVFGGIKYLDDIEFNGDVLRLFGQILGLEYEQRHQQWAKNGYWKDASQLQVYWEDQFDGYNMDWDQIRQYVFEPLTAQSANQLLETKKIDELSVMAWPYYNRKQTTKLLANYELSEEDKAFIAQLYPKNEVSSSTIQKLWVDAGYFTWTDNTKTALKITELGSEQEYLPDVSDGEQLTSASYMFQYGAFPIKNSSLKRVPQFNTSNIKDFSYMFGYCGSLTTIPSLDTSKGVNFRFMFYKCNSLPSIPELDTSNGTDFIGMFSSCESLVSIPFLDTSNGTDFNSMFYDCISLTSIPSLNTSNGANFNQMFFNCESLTSVPFLNTSKGILYFAYMFYGCKSLTSIPPLNTSKGIGFQFMFYDCKSLTSIPSLSTSNGTDFTYMFGGCEHLTNIPSLDTSKGAYFTSMFLNCSSLASKPQLDLSNAINVNDIFKGTPFE